MKWSMSKKEGGLMNIKYNARSNMCGNTIMPSQHVWQHNGNLPK